MKIKTWEARTNCGLTLDDLAILTGLSRGTLSNIENGITSPTLKQLEKIAKATNTRIIDLFESKYK